MVFADGFTPFYSTFLGFFVYHWVPPFVVLGTRTNVVLATLVAGPFLIFSLFSPFEDPPQKSLANLPLLGGPKGWPPILLFPKLLILLFRPTFWLLYFLSFSLNGQIPFCQVERSPITFLHGQPPCIARDTRLPLLKCWFLSHQSFFEPWVADETYPLSFFVSMSMLP